MEDLYFVAIGGSAGSVEPLMDFFDHTPLDGAAYIIVRHLPKEGQSQLKKLLARHSSLQILEATEAMKLEANTIYLSPTHHHLVIRSGQFHLIDRPAGPNTAIDLLFQSISKEGLEGRAIAVVLSGTGFDGVKGVGAIKDAGGMVIAQEPLSCEFDSIPKSAISTGAVDHVLTPSKMPGVIQAYVHAER